MTTLYIYDADNYQAHIDSEYANTRVKLKAPIAEFSGETNQDCEQQARDANYDDSDLFAWSYTKW